MKKQFELIQAIRGIAALLVVYFHTCHAPKFGAFGVDIFFVLSGAVMAMLMAQGPTGADFLWRRFARIFPLYLLATSAAYVVSCAMPSARTSGNIPSFADYLKSIAFIPHEAHNGEIVPVLGVGWTLNYEMAFYLCCAVACFIAVRCRALWAAAITACWVVGFGLLLPDSALGRFYTNPIVSEFIAGLGVWTVCAWRSPKLEKAWSLAIPLALVGLMAWAEWADFKLMDGIGSWERPVRYLLPAALVVGFGFAAEPAFQRLSDASRRALVLVGDASYAIYLTHVFIIGLFSMIFAKLGLPPVDTALGSLLACLASAAVGIAVYRWVEIPIQRMLKCFTSMSAKVS